MERYRIARELASDLKTKSKLTHYGFGTDLSAEELGQVVDVPGTDPDNLSTQRELHTAEAPEVAGQTAAREVVYPPAVDDVENGRWWAGVAYMFPYLYDETQEVAEEQRASIGCNIKWKAGNKPDYFA